jgi:hypothetical protein
VVGGQVGEGCGEEAETPEPQGCRLGSLDAVREMQLSKGSSSPAGDPEAGSLPNKTTSMASSISGREAILEELGPLGAGTHLPTPSQGASVVGVKGEWVQSLFYPCPWLEASSFGPPDVSVQN